MGTTRLIFPFKSFMGFSDYAKDWKLNLFDIGGCSLSILGVKLFSVCCIEEEKTVQKEPDKYINKFEENCCS